MPLNRGSVRDIRFISSRTTPVIEQMGDAFVERILRPPVRRTQNFLGVRNLQRDVDWSHAPVYELEVAEVSDALDSVPAGLIPAEAAARRELYGRIELRTLHTASLGQRLLLRRCHLMTILPRAVGLVTRLGGKPGRAAVVRAGVVVHEAFAFWQGYRAKRAIHALRQLQPAFARVEHRRAQQQQISVRSRCGGDVIVLAKGNDIPADARMGAAAVSLVQPPAPTQRPRVDDADRSPHQRGVGVVLGIPAGTGRGVCGPSQALCPRLAPATGSTGPSVDQPARTRTICEARYHRHTLIPFRRCPIPVDTFRFR